MIAQTKVELFNELLNRNYSEDDLRLILKTFEFGTAVFAGRFQTCGKPFLAHGVGTASILASLDAPAILVGAGIIHNVSSYGEFGFGVVGVSKAKTKYLRKVVGPQIEQYITQFPKFGIQPSTVQDLSEAIPTFESFERNLLLLSLAENLEKLANLEPLFSGNAESILRFLTQHGAQLTDMSARIGYPMLAESYRQAICRIQSTNISAVFRQHDRVISFFLPPKTFFRRTRKPILRVKPN